MMPWHLSWPNWSRLTLAVQWWLRRLGQELEQQWGESGWADVVVLTLQDP